MHATEREKRILSLLSDRGFISFPELERGIDASPATIRRDLDRMAEEGLLLRVRGGANLAGEPSRASSTIVSLAGEYGKASFTGRVGQYVSIRGVGGSIIKKRTTPHNLKT